MFHIRNAIGGRCDRAIEDIDLAIGAGLPEVVVRAAVAEAELEDGAGQVAHEPHRKAETVALCLQAPQGAVEPAHRAACARRSWAVVCHRRCTSTRMTSTPTTGKSINLRKKRSVLLFRIHSSVAHHTRPYARRLGK